MNKTAERLELHKILAALASFAVLDGSKEKLLAQEPVKTLAEANALLDGTEEATLLLFTLGSGRTEYFPPLGDKAERAKKGAALSCGELTDVAALLRSARVSYDGISSVADERIVLLRELTERLVFYTGLEEEIGKKIKGDELADDASPKLYELRKEIRETEERIRVRLAGYLSGEESKFLQDGLVTVRGDRFVIPVKAEYKRSVKGFVHDRSQSGATVFIEPEEVLNMNNDLITLRIDEKEEQERILRELSARVGAIEGALCSDEEILTEIDCSFARAEYGYKQHGVRPALNDKGLIDIKRGKHPLLDAKTAVPVSVSVGGEYDFLVVSGANAGGKTVTLKMCGLFCLMGACGLYVPAGEGTRLAVFKEIFCDLGDSQSIEESLSTFSSHVVNLKGILERADAHSLALIDEPGGGTDPEEGQALACAVLASLIKKGCKGIVTTHYFSLKEFAYKTRRAENACMEFDAEGQRPLFRLKIGAPGSSNALLVCEKLGLPQEVIEEARGFLSDGARSYEMTVRAAEESRIRADEVIKESAALKKEWETRLEILRKDEEKFLREREKFLQNSRAEAKRIVADRTAQAEDILHQIEEIFKKDTLSESDLIRARTLKNRIGEEEVEEKTVRRAPVVFEKLKAGDKVFVGSMEKEGEILSVRKDKRVCEVQIGLLKIRASADDLYEPSAPKKAGEKEKGVTVVRNVGGNFRSECNLIGMTVLEAESELINYLDAALLAGASQVRIVHGKGTGKLKNFVQDFLKKHPRVESYRLGNYGEGQGGVTIVTLR